MTIYSGFSHWKWWFSIVMLVYQRLPECNVIGNHRLNAILMPNFQLNPLFGSEILHCWWKSLFSHLASFLDSFGYIYILWLSINIFIIIYIHIIYPWYHHISPTVSSLGDLSISPDPGLSLVDFDQTAQFPKPGVIGFQVDLRRPFHGYLKPFLGK